MTLNNLAILLIDMGRPEDAKIKYDRALEMRESLLSTDPENIVYQSQVATTLNNLGNLLSDMGRNKDAKNKSERALEMRESLLSTGLENSVYQSQVATTLNNLGNLLSDMGRPEEAKIKYERALEMRESLHNSYLGNTIYQSRFAQTVLQFWETVIDIADSREPIDSVTDYKNAGLHLAEKTEYFQKLGLEYESFLAMRLGRSSELKYNTLLSRLESKPEKRASNYKKCIEIASILSDIERDQRQKEKWSGMAQYYEGRALVNESIIGGLNRKILKRAVEKFKNAGDSCEEALPCYCVYDAMLKVTGLSSGEIDLPDLKESIIKTQQKMPGGEATRTLLMKMVGAIEDGMGGADVNNAIQELNNEIVNIEYHATRSIFNYASGELNEYFKNPMEASVVFQNWKLNVTISGIEGKIKISTNEKVLWEDDVKERINCPFEPRNLEEKIIIESIEKPYRKRIIDVECCEIINNQNVFFVKRVLSGLNEDPMLGVAAVQISYEYEYSDNIWRPVWDDAYKQKIFAILEFLKGRTDCVVFPELSIPFEMLSELRDFADRDKILIIAGSHYIERKNIEEYNELFDHEFGEKDVRKSICPILVPDQETLHIEKIYPSREEDIGFDVPGMVKGEIQGIFSIGNYNFSVLICSDFMNPDLRSRIFKKANLVLVPQFNPSMDRFYKIANTEFQNPNNIVRAIVLANATGKTATGGSAIFRNLSRSDQKRSKDNFGYDYAAFIATMKNEVTKKFETMKDEMIIYSKINLAYISERTPNIWGDDDHPIDNHIIPIIQSEEKIVNLLNCLNGAEDPQTCIEILERNKELIEKTSGILFNNTSDVNNLSLEKMMEKCQAVIIS